MANTTFNPSDKSANITLTGGNLIVTATNGTLGGVRATDRQVVGKFYWECTCNTIVGGGTGVGFANSTVSLGVNPTTTIGTCQIISSANIYVNGANSGVDLGTITAGTVVCIAVDLVNELLWMRLSAAGNWNNNAANNPATGVGGIAIPGFGVGIPMHPAAWINGSTDQITANFGDTAFTGAVPSGYTSGFTAGASVPTNAIASQALAEHWLTTNPAAQITQVVAEHWASVASGNLQAVVTQVLLEHWTSVAVVVPAAGGPMVTMIH